MQLASEVAGALVAGVLVFVLARQAGGRSSQAAAAIGLVPVAIASVLALPNLREAGGNLLEQRRTNSVLTAEEAELQGGVGLGVNVAFLGWARAHFSPGDTFHLVLGEIGSSTEVAAVYQWSLFQLASHLELRQPDAADWLVFYDVSPAALESRMPGPLDIYSSGFAVARNDHAG